MKPAGFFTYPCRAQEHTPRNVPRQRFGSKIRQVLGISLLERVKSGAFLVYPYWENVKPDRFFTYPCRGVLHTPRNVPRQGFAPKIGQVLGISLLGMVKSGGFWAYPYWKR